MMSEPTYSEQMQEELEPIRNNDTKDKQYLVHFLPIIIDEEEKNSIKHTGCRAWVFEQAELRNIEYDWIEEMADE